MGRCMVCLLGGAMFDGAICGGGGIGGGAITWR